MNSRDPEYMLSRFLYHLREVFLDEELYTRLGTTREDFRPEMVYDLSATHAVNQDDFIESITWEDIQQRLADHPQVGRFDGRRLLVAPCSVLFDDILERLARTYPNCRFIDLNRSGGAIAGKTVDHPRDITAQAGDLCLIMTRNIHACESYEQQFGAENCLNLLRVYVDEHKTAQAPGTMPFVEKINTANKPILFVGSLPLATLNSTIRQMSRDGFSTFWLGSVDVRKDEQTNYATPKISAMSLNDYHIGNLLDFLLTFVNMERGLAFYHYETIYPPTWDYKRGVICYASTLALIRTVKECRSPSSTARLGLFMYDAIKPGVKHYEAGSDCGRLYLKMLAEAEAVIFSSFTKPFGDFIENAVGKPLPRVHHHRYQVVPKRRRPRLTDGYHIAVITSIMGEHWQPTTFDLVPYFRKLIVDQGLHIHYYMAQAVRAASLEFQASLPEASRHLFHLHDPIHDLDELAEDLSQYHAGWSLFDMQAFSEMINRLEDQFLRDAMDMFTPTTVPSVVWTCSAAGLPIICNRTLSAVVKMLPRGLTIPLTLSELDRLSDILQGMDWEAVDRIPLDQLDMARQIHKLYGFLENIYPA
ncbi:MAG: hypothetical protein QNK37_22720 [Acidobacteriota bacterium]|nr:hypothetical protein [Acidobacteriota bacterium]